MELPNESLPTPDQPAAIEAARNFMVEEIPDLARLFSIGALPIEVGSGWSTTLEPPISMTVDPGFFVERGYEPDWAVYATLHEVAAHVRTALWEPKLTKKAAEFSKQGEAQTIFHNILADVAGNKAIHARLPRLAQTAENLYHQKLFPDDTPPMHDPLEQQVRYQDQPRHIQFLYKMIREEMIPDSHTTVLTEVDEALGRLRNYSGSGQDIIAYSTNVAKPDGTPAKPEEQFGLWLSVIYPEFEKLLELDKQDPNFEEGSGAPTEGKGEAKPTDGSPTDGQQPGEQSPQEPQDGGKYAEGGKFDKYYKDYFKNKHPEPLNEDDHEVLEKVAKHISDEKKTKNTTRRKIDEAFKQETGHTLAEQQNYNLELINRRKQIEAIRDLFFKRVIEPRVGIKRRLGRTPQTEGAILDPNRLSETVMDIASGVEQPSAFLDYEHRRASTETVGNTDYYLVIDRSQSMSDGGKAANAASCTLIFLEGLAGVQADIEEAEAQYGVELDVSIRSGVYGFGNSAHVLKPLSEKVDTKERLDTYQAARQPLGEGTSDFLALEAINGEPSQDPDRRRIIVVLSDGESDGVERATSAVATLRSSPNTTVYGISIGSDAAVTLYAPDSRRCDNPDDLPQTLETLLEETLQ